MKNYTTTNLLLATLMLFAVAVKGQTLNPTPSINAAGAANVFKGGYTFSYATAGTPWNGALLSFGGFDNSYDCQISTDYGPHGGNHISFRTKNGDANVWNSWNELATRGVNNFTGDQVINGRISSSYSDDGGGAINLINSSKVSNGIAQKWTIYNMTGAYGNSLQFWAYDNLGCTGGMCSNRFTIMDNGNVGIGTSNPKNMLDVNGTIHSREVKVDMTGWSDFVFKKDYHLPTLEEVEKQITEKGHLENIPSEKEVLENGIELGAMNAKLLQKIEELTLYMIQMKKENEEQNKKQSEEIKYLKNKLENTKL